MSPVRSSGLRRVRRGGRRGFTAVELVTAVAASMAVAAAAYMLARTSLNVFQQEARMNAAQYSNMMAMNRLMTDVRRAGYQSSPDAGTDTTSLCSAPANPLDDLLVAVRVTDSDHAAGPAPATGPGYQVMPGAFTDAANVRDVDRVRFSGNYTTAERFKLANVDVSGGVLALDVDQLAVQRVFNEAVTGGPGICGLFPGNGIVRVVDPSGKAQFVQLVAAPCVANKTATEYTQVQLTVTGLGASGCITDPSQGYVNPIDVVDYSLVSLSAMAQADRLAYGFPNSIGGSSADAVAFAEEDVGLAGITGEDSRVRLVRRRLNGDGDPIANSAEIVADYVADFKITARSQATLGGALTFHDFGADLNGVPPNQLRAVGVRLTTRAKNPDRRDQSGAVPASGDVPLATFRVFGGAAVARFQYARVRTMYNEVSLPNLAAFVPWP